MARDIDTVLSPRQCESKVSTSNERLENDVIFNETFASEFRGLAKSNGASVVHARQDEIDAQIAGKQKRKRTGDSEIDFLVDQVQTVLTKEQIEDLANGLRERKMEGGFSTTSNELIGHAKLEAAELKDQTMLELFNGNMHSSDATSVVALNPDDLTVEASAKRIAKETDAPLWTQDSAIINELAHRSDAEIAELREHYKRITGKDLDKVLEKELSGDQKVLAFDYLKGLPKTVSEDYARVHAMYSEIDGGFASWAASNFLFGKPEVKEKMKAEHDNLNKLYLDYQNNPSAELEVAMREQLAVTRDSIRAFYNLKPNSASTVVGMSAAFVTTVVAGIVVGAVAVASTPVWVIAGIVAGATLAVGFGARFLTRWAVSGSYTDKDFSSDALHSGIEGATAFVGGGATQLAARSFATRIGTRLGAENADEALAIGQKALEATFKGKVISGTVSGVGGGATVGGITSGVQTGASKETWEDGILSGVQKTISSVWNGSFYGAVWGGAIGGSFGAAQWGWGKTVQPVLNKVSEKVSSAWDKVTSPITSRVSLAWDKVTSPITSRVSSAWHEVFDPVSEGASVVFAKLAFWRNIGATEVGSTVNVASTKSSTSAASQLDDQLEDILGNSRTYEQIKKGGQSLDDQLDDILGTSNTYEQMQVSNAQKAAPSQASSESADIATRRADLQRRLENLEAQWKSTNKALVDNPADDLARQDLDKLSARTRSLKEELADIDENWFDDLFGSGGSGGGNGAPRPESPMGGPSSRSQSTQQHASADAVAAAYGQPSPAQASQQPKAQLGVLEMEAPAPAVEPKAGRIIHYGEHEEIAVRSPLSKDELRKNVSRMLGQSDVVDMQSPLPRTANGARGAGSQSLADEMKPFVVSDAPPTKVVPNLGTSRLPGAEFGTAAAAAYGYVIRQPFISQPRREEEERRNSIIPPSRKNEEEKDEAQKPEETLKSPNEFTEYAKELSEDEHTGLRRKRLKAKAIVFGAEDQEYIVTKVEKT